MARTSDPHSATAQFFINDGDNNNLDFPSFDGWGYAVFGEVVEGLDVVDKIADVATGTKVLHARMGGQTMERAMKDVPNENVVIKSVEKIDEQ
jgi:peptidyl-prolyl cis-trans isomerase A (cyclophilin A)